MTCMHAPSNEYLSPGFIPMAHRGGALLPQNLGIENTLRAFRNAVELEFQYLETDVHATRDGKLIAFHDNDFSRMADIASSPTQMTFDQVREIRIGGTEQIPTLDELLEEFPEQRFNIDIKEHSATPLLVEALKRHAAHDRVCVGSFSSARITKFRKMLPHVPTSAAPMSAGLLPMGIARTRGDVFQIPIRHKVLGVTLELITPKTVQAIHQAGKKVHVWTINDELTMHRLIEWGVDGIITDRPDLLKTVMRMRGMWSTQ